jgi:hypothetical protein
MDVEKSQTTNGFNTNREKNSHSLDTNKNENIDINTKLIEKKENDFQIKIHKDIDYEKIISNIEKGNYTYLLIQINVNLFKIIIQMKYLQPSRQIITILI